MNRVHWLNLGPWPYFVGFTASPEAFEREMKRMKVRDADDFLINSWASAVTHSFCTAQGDAAAIICMGKTRRSKEQSAAIIAHEAVHVVQRMRERLGELGREAEAYLVQQIVQECLQVAWDTGRTIRRRPS